MDRFIVGSGRCGSTLLSRMLSHHPQLLSLFEFFTGLEIDKRFLPGSAGGVRPRRLDRSRAAGGHRRDETRLSG